MDNMATKNNKNTNNSAIDAEVEKLFKLIKKGKITNVDYSKLRDKYDDVELVKKKYYDIFISYHQKQFVEVDHFCQELRNTEFPQDVLKDIFNKLDNFTSSLKRDSDKIKDFNEKIEATHFNTKVYVGKKAF